MLFDGKFREFIDSTVPSNPRAKNPVDVYGEFTVQFRKCEGSFSNQAKLGTIIADSGIPDISNGTELPDGTWGSTFYNTDFHGLLRNINDMELSVNAKTMDLPGVSYALHRLMPMKSSPSFTMLWLSTATPYIEKIFVPWMTANTIENSFPMLKADLVITFPMLSDTGKNIEFWYYGVRPIECGLHKTTNEALIDFYRKVTMDFDYFYCYPNGK